MTTLAPFATTRAPNGMVCSIDQLASGAGVAMLRAGGSAADAAVAASAVLAVTAQHVCGMGGDLFALVHDPGLPGAAPAALNASGRAGSGADPDRLRAEGHDHMPVHGDIRSVPVPGCVDGWLALHERFGRLELATVLAPARDYAAHGFPATDLLARSAAAVVDLEGADDYRRAAPVRPGTIIRRPGVAAALDAIATDGRDGFYRGPFGDGLLRLGGGEYRREDLAAPHADWVSPLSTEVWGRTVWTPPPNSQGYLVLAAATIAAGLDLPSDTTDPRWAHLLIESARLASFDRPDVLHEHADGAALIAAARLGERRAAIDPDRRCSRPGQYGEGGTMFLAAVDAGRMAVALIQSNALGFGARVIEPATGIFLQNRGLGFSLVPGHPAEYGPGRRPPHTLSPVIVTGPQGRLDIVAGTMGGDSQPQILLQLLYRLLVGGEAPAAAVAAPRWVLGSRQPGAGGFDTWRHPGEDDVRLEDGARPWWAAGLEERGHTLGGPASFGHAQVIRVEPAGGLAGAADPRALAGAALGL